MTPISDTDSLRLKYSGLEFYTTKNQVPTTSALTSCQLQMEFREDKQALEKYFKNMIYVEEYKKQ